MEDRPAIGGSFCLECPYTCTTVCIRYLKPYNPQYGKGQQYMDHIKQTYRMVTKKGKLGPIFLYLSTHNQHIWATWVLSSYNALWMWYQQAHLRMNIAPDQTIILGVKIFLDHRPLSSIDQEIFFCKKSLSVLLSFCLPVYYLVILVHI